MASNFQLFFQEGKDRLHLKLCGDFDGTSAFELIHVLRKYKTGPYKIFIDTSDLNTIHTFGKQVFQKKLGSLHRQFDQFAFVGRNKHHFKK
jgi:anti-anti-sigma regulatory factor